MTSTKPFIAACPHCEGTIYIDPVARTVTMHKAESGKRMDSDAAEKLFGETMGKIRKRREERDMLFDQAKSTVRSRSTRAEDAFKKAKKKIAEQGDDDDRANLIHPFRD